MNANEKLIKPLTEVKYLNADNVNRYRCIMRIFFENYERLKYWLYQDEVYAEMHSDPMWHDYKLEQCQQDLSMLTEWKNLNTIQDTRNVSTIDEFKNKKYRYQMSEYSVEIERLVRRLENLHIDGASLEPTLLERIRLNIEQLTELRSRSASDVYSWWSGLNNDFVRLNQNYQDYIRSLNSVKAEEMMKTKEFLIFKDKLVEYLRSFIKGLQRNVGVIEECLLNLDKEDLNEVMKKIIEYELEIPRIDSEVSNEMIKKNIRGRFESIFNWFVGKDGRDNEAAKLFDATNEIIRRITRYGAALSERNAIGSNRKEEYRIIANIFLKCTDVSEAHKMSAMVFGMEKPFHIHALNNRGTESYNAGVYEESPFCLELKPRTRNYREKSRRTPIIDSKEKRLKAREKLMKQQQEEIKKIKALEKNSVIDFSNLPTIEPRIREILLKWISNALESEDLTSRTDDGRSYYLELGDIDTKCVVFCEDGNFTMPKMKLIFQEEPR